MNKKRFTIEMIARQAIIASLYVVLTVAISPLSYGNIQFRIAEILVFLCFFRHDYIIGLTLGCFIANLFSPMLIWDITLGVAATIIALVLMIFSKNIYIAAIWPVLSNAFIVAIELHFAFELPYFLSALEVGIGEAGVMIVGLIVFILLSKNKRFMYFLTLDEKYLATEVASSAKVEEASTTEEEKD